MVSHALYHPLSREKVAEISKAASWDKQLMSKVFYSCPSELSLQTFWQVFLYLLFSGFLVKLSAPHKEKDLELKTQVMSKGHFELESLEMGFSACCQHFLGRPTDYLSRYRLTF